MAARCWSFWAWWLPLMLAVASADQQAESCSANSCGNLTISDPFWLTDIETGRSCGNPDFKVSCRNNSTVLQGYGIFGFSIISITYEERSMRAIDLGKVEIIQASNSCYNRNWNTSAKLLLPFRIDPVNLDLILYNCTEVAAATVAARQDREIVKTRLMCGNQSEMFVRVAGSYNDASDSAGYAIEGCEAIVVPVLGGAYGKAKAGDYKKLISDGFLLSWDGHSSLPLAQLLNESNHVD
uniref:Uncharacterized protein n=1 Tax=Avena sativa TaxID=4498 RepID=A0ACD5TQK7_AVESA